MLYPYPVQYFFCTDYDTGDMSKFMQSKIQASVLISTAVGPVRGETGIAGLKLDFNYGLRLQVPEGDWHVRISDADSGKVFLEQDVSEKVLISVETYYVRWLVDVAKDGVYVFSHTLDVAGQKVYFVYFHKAIGDALALFPYIRAFQRERNAEVSYYVMDSFQELFHRFYPDIPLRSQAEEDTYATYVLAAGVKEQGYAPLDGRTIPMWQMGQFLLGLHTPVTFRDVSKWPLPKRAIKEPYVCVGIQATTVLKGWLYPNGWNEVVAYLRSLGYRVLCIDKDRELHEMDCVSKIPEGAEDFTGERPLEERADLLFHAAFFIGLGSGLSWLANAVGCPVVLISGFSRCWAEFPTPYRVFNKLVCNGCYNDLKSDFLWKGCAFDRNSKRWMECSTTISPVMVIEAIDRLRREEQR